MTGKKFVFVLSRQLAIIHQISSPFRDLDLLLHCLPANGALPPEPNFVPFERKFMGSEVFSDDCGIYDQICVSLSSWCWRAGKH